MNQRLEAMRGRVRDRLHASSRQAEAPDVLGECEALGLSWTRRAARLTRRMCEAERPQIEADQQIVFTRTVPQVPPIYSADDWQRLTAGRTLHELGPISNICADWGRCFRRDCWPAGAWPRPPRSEWPAIPRRVEFLEAAVETIDAVLDLADRYAEAAREQGRHDLAAILDHVPAQPPRTLP